MDLVEVGLWTVIWTCMNTLVVLAYYWGIGVEPFKDFWPHEWLVVGIGLAIAGMICTIFMIITAWWVPILLMAIWYPWIYSE